MEAYLDPAKRHDFVMLFDATNSNPNGDPDAGNLPRIDSDTDHGIVTDVALKRKIRNYVALSGKPIFIQSQVSLNQLIMRGFRDAGIEPAQMKIEDEEVDTWLSERSDSGELAEVLTYEAGELIYGGESRKPADITKFLTEGVDESEAGKKLRAKLRSLASELGKKVGSGITQKNRDDARTTLCNTYFDIRMFGAVLSTGLNAGQVRGPMQLGFARSIDPIQPRDLTITRQARTTAERMLTGSTEMGRKQIVSYGLYRAHGFYSAKLGKDLGVTEADLTLFWNDRSAARPEMDVRGLYVFSHDSELGNAASHKLFECVSVARRPEVEIARRFGDYNVNVNRDSLPNGITLKSIVPCEPEWRKPA